jgi:8-oxo-dGTP pyrophosphatase MutT (NUDIX family)
LPSSNFSIAGKLQTDLKSLVVNEAQTSQYKNQCSLVLESNNPFSRATLEGHVTASGLVIQDGKVLLIFHPFIRRWFQPGGHIDEGETPIQAAIREVYEETGFVCELDSENQAPIDIDIHEIPANPKKDEGAHLHIDLLYKLRVLRQETSAEDIECRWFSFDDIDSDRLKRALAKLA